MSKPAVKKAAARKTPAETAKTAKTGAAKLAAPVKQRAKAAPAHGSRAKAPAPITKKPVKRPAAKKAAVTLAPKALPKAAAKTATEASHPPLPNTKLKAPAKSAKKSTPAPAPTPPLPLPTNRFTDRFAPASPTKKAEHVPMDLAKPTIKVDPKVANAWKTKAGRDLSEAELLAMPEGEYMHDKQLDFFRAKLTQQMDDLLSNAGETTEHLREDTTIVPDPADRATIEEEHALELRTRDRERKLLKKVAQSLDRLETGEYGYCDETGEPIGLARLLARPTATLSLEAQQRREMKQKMFGN